MAGSGRAPAGLGAVLPAGGAGSLSAVAMRRKSDLGSESHWVIYFSLRISSAGCPSFSVEWILFVRISVISFSFLFFIVFFDRVFHHRSVS